jgi:hypothetical protein
VFARAIAVGMQLGFPSAGLGAHSAKLTRLSKTLGGLVMVLSLLTFAASPAREMLLLVPGR